MQIFLLQTSIDFEIVFISLFAFAISLIILYYIIRNAVTSALKTQNRILEEQNQLLVMLLNQQGVSKDVLSDIFLLKKKGLWPSLKN